MSRAEAGSASLYHRVVVYLLFAILVLPLVGTFVYSIASSWSATILPAGFTLKWYVQLWSDPRFLAAFGQSLLVCVGALVLSVVLILPLLAKLDTDFSDPIKAALLSTRSDQATKVAWQSPRFWETDYRTYGGLSWIEHPARLLWYPSNGLNTRDGLLVAGYVTGEGADRFGAQPLAQQYATSKEAVELLHPGYAKHLRHPLAVSWEQILYSEGPWLQREHFPADASALLEAGVGRVYFAGDGLVQSGVGIWQESAANSARHVVAQLAERVTQQRQIAAVAAS